MTSGYGSSYDAKQDRIAESEAHKAAIKATNERAEAKMQSQPTDVKIARLYTVSVTHGTDVHNCFRGSFVHIPSVTELLNAIQARVNEYVTKENTNPTLDVGRRVAELQKLQEVLKFATEPNVTHGQVIQVAGVRLGSINVEWGEVYLCPQDPQGLTRYFPTASLTTSQAANQAWRPTKLGGPKETLEHP